MTDPLGNYDPFHGVYQDTYGNLSLTSVRDMVEDQQASEGTSKTTNDFIGNSSAVNHGLKALEEEMSGIKSKQPQTVGGGRLFRAKPKARRGKYA
jgi:hypothetical protein